ncbi:hypothetical protein [Parasphingorhabdus halotolerans]|uniref:Uncharacterized protein n=1 Tax=Parasphingorhabdus halotolerans TaxID=2725558 RepID=A0A6H2DKM3_9SPHN|nr:hypothetical protein [Parasphingorhabdus halotolerans]QJB68206.1 hypothetical protein HF685_01900 [Parasphingorhabdus halotolerans]
MMKFAAALPLSLFFVSACSETPIEEHGGEAAAEMEQQIEAEAKTLEQAADEAVEILDAEIEAELEDEGVGKPAEPVAAPAEESATGQ